MFVYTNYGLDKIVSTNFYDSLFDPNENIFVETDQIDTYNGTVATIYTTLGVIDFNLDHKLCIVRDGQELFVKIDGLMEGDTIKLYNKPYNHYQNNLDYGDSDMAEFYAIGCYNTIASGSPYITDRLNPYYTHEYQSYFKSMMHFPDYYVGDFERALRTSLDFKKKFLDGLNIARSCDVSLYPLSYHRYTIEQMKQISLLALSVGVYYRMDLEHCNLEPAKNTDCIVKKIVLGTGKTYKFIGVDTFLADGCYLH